MITLHVAPTKWAFNPSPFCEKVEVYCRLAGIPFERVHTQPVGAPRGKLPWLSDGALRVPDSGLILEYLAGRFGDRLDGALDERARAEAHLIRRTCEESLYFTIVYSRWIDPVGWAVIKPLFFGDLPPLVRDVVPGIVRRSTRQALRGQGYGRHAPEEVYALGTADLTALAAMLNGRPFAVGDHPTSCDATLYAFLLNILEAPVESPLKVAAGRYPVFADYLDRMRGVLAAR